MAVMLSCDVGFINNSRSSAKTMKDVKKDVYTLLNLLPNTRRSDDTLIKCYCNMKKISTDFNAEGEHITSSVAKSIYRYRRKHQKEFPNLYPVEIKEMREQERQIYKERFKK